MLKHKGFQESNLLQTLALKLSKRFSFREHG